MIKEITFLYSGTTLCLHIWVRTALDGVSLFGQILRREELRVGEKYVGIGKNGRRPLRRRRSTWNCRAK
jgi:hypothetical protein